MRLRTLGGLELGASDFHRVKPLVLLAYLVLEGPKDRRTLSRLFWPDAADPRNSLAKALSQLRAAAPEVLRVDATRAAALVGSDVAGLRAAVAAGDARTAQGLYRGAFLAGVSLRDWSVELEEWVYATRELLAAELREALVRAAEASACAADPGDAVRYAEGAWRVAGAPPCEPETLARLHELMLRGSSPLLAAVRAEAASYDLALDAVPPAPAPASLPPATTPFFGREAEVTRLEELLGSPACRLVTLTGAGGNGKTRLALRVAERAGQRGDFRGGVVFASMASAGTVEELPLRVAQAARVRLPVTSAPLEELAAELGDRELLLVLDNLEHLEGAAEAVGRLLSACPHVRVIATSRSRLHLSSEWIVDLGGLAVPGEGASPAELRAADAVRLFAERAERKRPGSMAHDAAWRHAAAVCRVVAGSPLGIELAAGWVRSVPLAEMVARTERGLELLRTDDRDVPARHRSVDAVVGHSWRLLTLEERHVLARLSVFSGGFEALAAERVAGAGPGVLAALVDKSLLHADGGGRFSLHALVERFARARLELEPDQRVEVAQRHAAHYLGALDRWHVDLPHAPLAAMAGFEADRPNVLAAWNHAVTAGDDAAVRRAAAALLDLCYRRGAGHDPMALFAAAVARLQALPSTPERPALLGELLLYQAIFAFYAGRLRETDELVGRGLPLLRAGGNTSSVRRSLNLRGGVALYTGRYRDARASYAEALELARNDGGAGARSETVAYLDNLGHVARALGQLDLARRHYREALDAARGGHAAVRAANALQNLGCLMVAMGRPYQARALLRESTEVAGEHGFDSLLPYVLAGQAAAALALGEVARARRDALEAARAGRAADDRLQEAAARVLAGTALLRAGEAAAAETELLGVLADAHAMGARPCALDAIVRLAEAREVQGDAAAARTLRAVAASDPAASFEVRTEALLRLEGIALIDASGAPLRLARESGPADLDEAVWWLVGRAPDGARAAGTSGTGA